VVWSRELIKNWGHEKEKSKNYARVILLLFGAISLNFCLLSDVDDVNADIKINLVSIGSGVSELRHQQF